MLVSARRWTMAIDAHSRNRLHLRLEQVLGPEEAATLMRLLSERLDQSESATGADMTAFSQRPRPDLDAHMEGLTKELILWTCAMMVAAAVLAFLAGRFV